MAVPACFHLADDVFPRVRAEAARRFAVAGWSQTRIAATLRVSQAMVSKYVAREDREADPLVLRLVQEVVDGADDPAPANAASGWCTTLSMTDGRPGADAALQDLLAAERELARAPPLHVVPQVGLNLARALPGARTAQDVLSFPGRLVVAGDRLLSPVAPAFGASRHLAAVLLALHRADPNILAVANLRGGPDLAGLAGLSVVPRGPDAPIDPDAAVLDAAAPGPLLLHDPGAFGIEPCLYVAGRDAADVVARIRTIPPRTP